MKPLLIQRLRPGQVKPKMMTGLPLVESRAATASAVIVGAIVGIGSVWAAVVWLARWWVLWGVGR